MNFKHDEGYIYYSEFIYKIFLYKYEKLRSNIFQIVTKSISDEDEELDLKLYEQAKMMASIR